MEAFEGVFTKRGETEASDCNPTGVFDEVFVQRRGRWRKGSVNSSQQSGGDVVHLAEHVVSGLCTVEYPMPSLSDIANVDPPKAGTETMPGETNVPVKSELSDPANYVVKNTFLDASVIDFDSLQDFLKARKVKSCPASRQVSSVTMLAEDLAAMQEMCVSGAKDDVLNTASSFGGLDIPFAMATQKGILECSDDASIMPSGSDSDLALREAVFNTASTLTGVDFELLQQRLSEVSDESDPQVVENVEEAALEGQQMTAEERLRRLRAKGSEIQQKMGLGTPQETQFASGATFDHQSFTQWLAATQMAKAMMQVQAFPPPPCEPPVINAALTAEASVPPPPPPPPALDVAPPVLRLADAIAAPELGSPELPSIGSMLHRKGECKPCTFFHTRGCENKEKCEFCHLCGPGEKKKRLKAVKAANREANYAALENAKATLASYRAAEEQNFQVDMIIE